MGQSLQPPAFILSSMLSGFSFLLAPTANNPNPTLKEGTRGRCSRCIINLFPRLYPSENNLQKSTTQKKNLTPLPPYEYQKLMKFRNFDYTLITEYYDIDYIINFFNLCFPSFFLDMILEMNFKQHFVQAAAMLLVNSGK